jgi:hypothetical protein
MGTIYTFIHIAEQLSVQAAEFKFNGTDWALDRKMNLERIGN